MSVPSSTHAAMREGHRNAYVAATSAFVRSDLRLVGGSVRALRSCVSVAAPPGPDDFVISSNDQLDTAVELVVLRHQLKVLNRRWAARDFAAATGSSWPR